MGSGNHFFNKKHTSESLQAISVRNIQKKLTPNDIAEIKYLWDSEAFKQPELAKMFNVGQPYISKIVNNRRRVKIY